MKKEIVRLILAKKNEIIVVYPYSHSEISNPKFGGTRLIHEQIEFLKDNGYKVSLISLEDIGSITSFLYKIGGKLRRKIKANSYDLINFSQRRKWWLDLLQVTISEFVSRIDFLFRTRLQYLQRYTSFPANLIYNYPFCVRNFAAFSKDFPAKIIIYEHNIEWKFFEDKIGENLVGKFFVWLIKKIELGNLRKADYIFCANVADKEKLVKAGISGDRIKMWVPIPKKISLDAKKLPVELKTNLRGSFLVGFVGTNFEPNIAAVENITQIAKKVPENVQFLIIGSVNRAFENNNNLPSNVIFTGYVEDLDHYLALCDAFINPKTTSNSGIEIKMFDYLKFDKPIISTKMGAAGFEDFKNIIICKNPEVITEKIREFAEEVSR